LHYGVTGSTSTAAETEAGMLLAVTSLDPEKPPSETIASATFCNGVPDAGTVIAGAGRLPGAAIWPVAAIGADADAGAFLGGTATDMSGDGVFSGNGKGGLGTGFAALPNVAMETVEAAAMAAVNGVAVKGATESCGLSVWATAVGALGTTCAAMSDRAVHLSIQRAPAAVHVAAKTAPFLVLETGAMPHLVIGCQATIA